MTRRLKPQSKPDAGQLWRAWHQVFKDFIPKTLAAHGVVHGPEGAPTLREALAKLPNGKLLDLAELLARGVPQMLTVAPGEHARNDKEADELRELWRRQSLGVFELLDRLHQPTPPGRCRLAGRSWSWSQATGLNVNEGDTALGDLLRFCLTGPELRTDEGLNALVGRVCSGSQGRKSDEELAVWFRAMIEMGPGWRGSDPPKPDSTRLARWLAKVWGIKRSVRTVREAARKPWTSHHDLMAKAIIRWFLERGVLLPGEEDEPVSTRLSLPLPKVPRISEPKLVTLEHVQRALDWAMKSFGMKPRGQTATLAQEACRQRIEGWKSMAGARPGGPRNA